MECLKIKIVNKNVENNVLVIDIFTSLLRDHYQMISLHLSVLINIFS